jgi:methyl-accepting chemotaxis protein
MISKEMILANTFAFIFIIITLLIVIKLTNLKINGPLYHIKKDLEKIEKGDLSFNITIRYKDEFKYFVNELNYMINNLRNIFSSIKKNIDTIGYCTRDIERHHSDTEIVMQKNQQLIEQIEALQHRLHALNGEIRG